MATLTAKEMSDLLYPGLHAIFINRLKLRPSPWTEFMNVETSTRYSETDFAATALGPFREKLVGKEITYDSPVRVGTKTYVHKTYALGYRVEEELWEDDQYGQIKKYPGMLADSANHTLNIVGHLALNNGWVTTETLIDGVCLFNTAHPLVKAGGTQSNTFATAQEFSRTALQSALISLRKWKTHEGRPAVLKPVGIICGPDIEPEVWDAISNPKVPESNANANNWVARQNLKAIVTDWLLGTKWWIVVCQKSDHTLTFFWRVKLTYKNDTHFDTGDMRYKGRCRCTAGATGPDGLYGSNPS